jgi:hypothetical protein
MPIVDTFNEVYQDLAKFYLGVSRDVEQVWIHYLMEKIRTFWPQQLVAAGLSLVLSQGSSNGS